MYYQFDWRVLIEYRSLLLDGLLNTLEIAGLTLLFSALLGVIIGTIRHFSKPAIRWLCAAYVEFFRNVPPIVQLFFWYFAAGLDIFPAAIIGLSVYSSAYLAEAVRSGYRSTPKTQIEAARSSGLGYFQMLYYVLIPQSMLRITPALTVEFINVFKNSSIAMTIGVAELTFQAQEINSITFRGFEAATAVTVIYIILIMLLVMIARAIENILRVDLRSS
jgi:polar amino acid transport system permease protein